MKEKKKKKYIPPKIDLLGEGDANFASDCVTGGSPTFTCDHGCVVDCGVAATP